jgi:hypothetical protein
VVEALRSRHYSRRTEEAYLHWIRRFLGFHDGAHARQLAEQDLNRFLLLPDGQVKVDAAQRFELARRWQKWQQFTPHPPSLPE